MKNYIEFRLNLHRVPELICWLASRGDGGKMGMHEMMKILFFADVKHLNKYYVPIIGGHYVAREYGPVHAELYDILTDNYPPAWEIEANFPFILENRKIIPTRDANEKRLSKANLICLESALQEYKGTPFMDLTGLSRDHIAWEKPWKARTDNSPTMRYEDFFDHKVDKQILEDLVTYGRAISV